MFGSPVVTVVAFVGAVAVAAVVAVAAGVWFPRRSRKRHLELEEDILKRFYQFRRQDREVQLEALTGALPASLVEIRACLDRMIARGLLRADGHDLRLSRRGLEAARSLTRSHRILETHLADHTGHPPGRFHRLADRLEHRLSPQRIEELDRSLGRPQRDPHGDAIPDTAGRVPEVPRLPLDLFPVGSVVRVTHVEDEPEALYRDLLDDGIVLGTELEVLANDDSGMRLHVAGRGECGLDALAAGQVDVAPSDTAAVDLRRLQPLSALKLGQLATIALLTSELRGEARRRLLDLGFTPGAEVQPVLTNALGDDPTAYLIRQSKIALRRDQSRHILVVADEGSTGTPNEEAA